MNAVSKLRNIIFKNSVTWNLNVASTLKLAVFNT